MSQGTAIDYVDALAAATTLRTLLEPACERVEIAGSVRRHKPEVHDLELVAIAKVEDVVGPGLWGQTVAVNRLEDLVRELVYAGVLAPRAVEIHRRDGSVESGQRMGAAYKALAYHGIPVDLFITDAERWGCIFALRTGPGDWNTRLVTDCRRHWRRVEDGRVLYHNRPVPTPEEADFFRTLGVPWLEPQERRLERLRFDPELLKAVEP